MSLTGVFKEIVAYCLVLGYSCIWTPLLLTWHSSAWLSSSPQFLGQKSLFNF